MTQTRDMLRSHPTATEDRGDLIECIEACYDCAQTCTTCADACLAEPEVANMVRCIRTNLDCAAVCIATGQIVARVTEPDRALIQAQVAACAEACRVCAEECEKHAAHMEHCRICAAECRRCEEACRRLLAQM